MEIKYYLDSVTSLYRTKPKFIAWLTATLNKLNAATTLAEAMDMSFDLDQAEGVQLDILGEVIGQNRQVNFQPTDGSSPILVDDYYRTLLKAKVVKNLWKGQVNELQPIWETLFPGGQIIIRDNQDMTMDVGILGDVPLTVRDLVKYGYIVPKPQSVGINFYFFGAAPVFGYDVQNEFIAGYDSGIWAILETVTLFGYDQDDLNVTGYDQGSW